MHQTLELGYAMQKGGKEKKQYQKTDLYISGIRRRNGRGLQRRSGRSFDPSACDILDGGGQKYSRLR